MATKYVSLFKDAPAVNGLAGAVEDSPKHVAGHGGGQHLRAGGRREPRSGYGSTVPNTQLAGRQDIRCTPDHSCKTHLSSELQRRLPVVNARGTLEHLHHSAGPIHLQNLAATQASVPKTNLHNFRILWLLQLGRSVCMSTAGPAWMDGTRLCRGPTAPSRTPQPPEDRSHPPRCGTLQYGVAVKPGKMEKGAEGATIKAGAQRRTKVRLANVVASNRVNLGLEGQLIGEHIDGRHGKAGLRADSATVKQ